MIPSGWVVPVPIALPNVFWALFPGPAESASSAALTSRGLRLVGIIESTGRVAVFALPFFLEWHVQTMIDRVLVCIGVLALAVYYVGWGRYFFGSRSPRLLFAPLCPLAVPLAVSPIIYFLAFAVLARSPIMAVVTALFGPAHIFLSLRRSRSA